MLQIYLKVFLKFQVITRKQLTMVYLKAVHLMGLAISKVGIAARNTVSYVRWQ